MGGRLALILAIIAALVYHASFYWSGAIDDSYITFRYAQHWMSGQGMVYNPGENLEGITNLGWAMLLAPFTRLDVLYVTKILGLLFGVITVVLAEGWMERARISLVPRAIALILLVLVPWVPTHLMMGMETPVEMLTVTMGWSLYEREREKGGPWSSLGMAAGPWFRPDAAVLPILLGILHWVRPQLDRRVARAAAIVVVSALALLLLKLYWFGEIVPNTFYVKTDWPPERGIRYLSHWLTQPAPFLSYLSLAGVVVSLWILVSRRDFRGIPGLFFGVWLGVVLLENGDFMVNYRLLAPAWPAAVVAIGVLAEEALRWLPPPALLLVPLAGVPAAGVYTLDRCSNEEPGSSKPKAGWTPDLEAGFVDRTAFPVAWALIHANGAISFPDIGVLGYLYEGPVIDPLGLTDRVLAGRLPEVDRSRYLSERVSYLMLDTRSGIWPKYRPGLVADHWQLVDGCENLWILSNPAIEHPKLSTETLRERLQTVRARAPRERWLDQAITRELQRVAPELVEEWAAPMRPTDRCAMGLDGCAPPTAGCEVGARVRPEEWADPATWPASDQQATGQFKLRCHDAIRLAEKSWNTLADSWSPSEAALARRAADAVWAPSELEREVIASVRAGHPGNSDVEEAIQASQLARTICEKSGRIRTPHPP